MAMQTCKVCGKQYRTGRLVFIMGDDGRLKGARVCQGCADDGVTIVAKKPLAFCSTRGCKYAPTLCHAHAVETGRHNKATFAEGAAEALEAQLAGMSRTAPGSQTNADDFMLGKIEQLTNDIAFLKEGRW